MEVKPIWYPTRPTYRGERYFYYSPRLRRRVGFASKLEFERSLLLEFSLDVVSYCEQPAEASALVDGKVRRSRFDFVVSLKNGSEVYEEIKYTEDLKRPGSRANLQIRVQKAWCLANGKEHRTVTEDHIWARPQLIVNLRRMIAAFGIGYVDRIRKCSGLMENIKAAVASRPGVTVRQVLQMRPHSVREDLFRLALFELIRIGQIDARLGEVDFNPRTPLFPEKGGAE